MRTPLRFPAPTPSLEFLEASWWTLYSFRLKNDRVAAWERHCEFQPRRHHSSSVKHPGGLDIASAGRRKLEAQCKSARFPVRLWRLSTSAHVSPSICGGAVQQCPYPRTFVAAECKSVRILVHLWRRRAAVAVPPSACGGRVLQYPYPRPSVAVCAAVTVPPSVGDGRGPQEIKVT